MSDIAEKVSYILNGLMSEAGVNETDLGRKTSIPRTTINRLAAGKTPDPRASTLRAIADYFNISVDQLMGKQPLQIFSQNNELTAIRTIPVLPLPQAKNWQQLLIKNENGYFKNWVALDPLSEKAQFAVILKGEAMFPMFQEEMILIIDPEREPCNRDFVLLWVAETDEVLFRQLIIENHYRFAKAINSLFPPITLSIKDRLLGTVVQTRNNFLKTHFN